jgi:hypothetical protein
MKLEIYRDVYMPDYDAEKGKSYKWIWNSLNIIS